jgi:predicted anti-sigma-YlaC factor YlaD
MKVLNLIGWISGGIGVILIFLGTISGLIGKTILSINHAANYFLMANSFLLVAVALFIVVNRCECNKK